MPGPTKIESQPAHFGPVGSRGPGPRVYGMCVEGRLPVFESVGSKEQMPESQCPGHTHDTSEHQWKWIQCRYRPVRPSAIMLKATTGLNEEEQKRWELAWDTMADTPAAYFGAVASLSRVAISL